MFVESVRERTKKKTLIIVFYELLIVMDKEFSITMVRVRCCLELFCFRSSKYRCRCLISWMRGGMQFLASPVSFLRAAWFEHYEMVLLVIRKQKSSFINLKQCKYCRYVNLGQLCRTQLLKLYMAVYNPSDLYIKYFVCS